MTAATSEAPAPSRRRPDRPPAALYGAVVLVTALELVLAWRTHGTYDITIWRSFAATVDRVGPIDIYSLDGAGLMVYNHPALVGCGLMVVNAGIGLRGRFRFLLRV